VRTFSRMGEGTRLTARSRRGITGLVLLLCAGMAVVLGSGGPGAFTPGTIQGKVLAMGGLGVLGFLFASAARPLSVILSGSLFSVAAGLIWGPVSGLAVALAGVALGAGFGWLLARSLGAGAVRDVAGARYERFSRLAQAGGFSLVFVATLGFLLPSDLVIAVAAVAGVRLRSVVAACVLGSLPGTIAMVLIGASVIEPTPMLRGLAFGAVLVLTALAALLGKYWLRTAPEVGDAE
jgi:uncharacterized membrane protein YdjX (TVP38/TMEM64 family)